jgi:hypothetical protein
MEIKMRNLLQEVYFSSASLPLPFCLSLSCLSSSREEFKLTLDRDCRNEGRRQLSSFVSGLRRGVQEDGAAGGACWVIEGKGRRRCCSILSMDG